MGAPREGWSGRAGFIFATIGSAIGLGSIWKFPYEVGANGGSVFLFFYLAGLVLVVVPLMFAEFAIGRRGGADAAGSLAAVAAANGASRGWGAAGVLGIVTGLIILSFYSVIGGWTLAYASETLRAGLPGTTLPAVQASFDALLGSPWRLAAFHLAFLAIAIAIVARGVGGGIEAACRVLMPVLAALMIALAAYSAVEGDLDATLDFLLRLDASRLNARAALEALGLGFFSIGVGLGLMITYAAYAGVDVNLRQVAVASVAADTAISLLAGFAVFPIVFAHGLDPASGPRLMFVTLPLAFASMPFGTVAAIAFFILLFVAALASAISMLELAVALLVRHFGWPRVAASLATGAGCFAAGLATVLSFNRWASWHPLAGVQRFATATVFDLLDYLTSDLLLPVGGFALCVFAGWVAPASVFEEELALTPAGALRLRRVLRYVAPACIAAATLAPLFA